MPRDSGTGAVRRQEEASIHHRRPPSVDSCLLLLGLGTIMADVSDSCLQCPAH